MADRSSDESVPDQTGARSATSRTTAESPSPGSASGSRTAQGARSSSGSRTTQPAKRSARKTAQPRKSAAKSPGGTAPADGSGSQAVAPEPGTPGGATAVGSPAAADSAPPASAEPMTERINAAYASSGPVLPDDAPGGSGGRPAAAPPRPTGAERVTAAVPRSRPDQQRSAGSRPWDAPRRIRKARLRVTHVDPWSVMKTAFLLAVAIGIVTVVAVAVVWSVLNAAGVWSSIDKAVGDVVGQTSNRFRVEDYIGLSRVLGFTLIVAVVDVILVTVIATLGAFLYNLAAALLGGVEMVLAEEEH
ncbi:MAG: hypothetical protein QOK15_3413 [Nocardioidaceae bacterium]|nr:hypothetical protein [Nocardioidaceae bacterium]